MEKLPEYFCESFQNSTPPYPDLEFFSVSTTNIFDNPNASLNPPFMGTTTPIQEPMTPPLLQTHVVSAGRLKNSGALSGANNSYEKNKNSMAAMREMIFQIAAMQPVHIDPESIKPPKRRNVKISRDPQSVAARHRRERISERIRILQRLVPGGTKMDTASMLDEAIHYVKFLKKQVQTLEQAGANSNRVMGAGLALPGMTMGNVNYSALVRPYCQPQPAPMVGSMQMPSYS